MRTAQKQIVDTPQDSWAEELRLFQAHRRNWSPDPRCDCRKCHAHRHRELAPHYVEVRQRRQVRENERVTEFGIAIRQTVNHVLLAIVAVLLFVAVGSAAMHLLGWPS